MLSLLHTPDGVRDYYGKELSDRAMICDRLRNVFKRYGYTEVVTPVFEYFDIFNAERGSVASRNMFKLFDNDGETMVLRPDFTPAMARCAVKYFSDSPVPVRLSYMGNRYVNAGGHRGKLRENMQAGAELTGDESSFADAEMLDMTAALLKTARLHDYILDVGDIRFFKGLLAEADIRGEDAQKIKELLSRKNSFGINDILEHYTGAGLAGEALAALPELYGDPEEVLAAAKKYDLNEETHEAIVRLESILQAAACYGITERLRLDMGMVSMLDYYTGMIFKAYADGAGEPVVSGGRYDLLMAQFGRPTPAVGFGLSVDMLMQAVEAAGSGILSDTVKRMVVFEDERSEEAISLAKTLRGQGKNVMLQRYGSIDRSKNDETTLRGVVEIYMLRAGSDEIIQEKV